MDRPTRAKRPRRPAGATKDPSTKPVKSGAAVADAVSDADESDQSEHAGNSTLGVDNFDEYSTDEMAPMNPRVRLKYVCGFSLHKWAGGNWDRCMPHPRINERMTEDHVGELLGPGNYRAIWYKPAKGMKNGKTRYGMYEFTVRAVGADNASAAPVQVAPAPTRLSALHESERLVPDGFNSTHQWVFSQLDTARIDREELMGVIRDAFTTIVTLSSKNGEMATQNASLAASIVTTMHEANKRDIDSRLGMAKELVDMRYAMLQSQNAGGMEKIFAQYIGRIADRFIPAGNAKPDQISTTLDKVDKTMPKLNSMADELPAMKAQMAEMQSFLRDARPALQRINAMTGGAEVPPEQGAPPAVPVTDAPLPDSVDV